MSIVKIKKPWETISDQKVKGEDGEVWMVSALIAQAKDLPVKEIPMDYISLGFDIGGIPVREFVSHMKLIFDADMSYPIILDEDAELFDGRHRVAKALFKGHETIKVQRFEEDPPATYIEKTEKTEK